ncbi:MAG: type III pantothenate kinase [Flavobacteriales bacterium]|nr:type III pantothenate kinase [Flavobacteriales bacterium]
MELIIDVGNTRAKAAVFINNGIHKIFYSNHADEEMLEKLKDFSITSIMICTVRKNEDALYEFWSKMAPTFVLTEKTKIPLINRYKTPETLGKDRIAAVIGARFLYPEGNLLVIDAGTCITYDILTADNQYLGGNISPGVRIRFKALNEFTGALPLVDDYDMELLFGQNTTESIASGVLNGLFYEIDGAISAYSSTFHDLKTIICGGEARYFVNRIKNKIFANQNLVLLGLHKILQFNA